MTFLIVSKIPTFLIFQIISSIIVGFMIWRKRKVVNLKSEKVFNFVILFGVVSVVTGRLFYVVQNFDQFKQISWSIYPFYYRPGAERVWFRQMPWIVMKFWEEGISYSALMLGGVVYTLIFSHLEKLTRKFLNIVVKAFCLGQIIQIAGFFIASNYIGKVIDSPIGIKYPVDDNYRIPIQFIEIGVLVGLVFLFKYLKKIKKSRMIFGIYLFVFGWLEVVVGFFKDSGEELSNGVSSVSWYGVNLTQLAYLIFIFIGILISVFAYQENIGVVNTKVEPIRSKVSTGLKFGNTKSGNSYMNCSYRDFKSSYTTYRKSRPSFMAWLKRKFFSKRRDGGID